jgi:hypothetical protein
MDCFSFAFEVDGIDLDSATSMDALQMRFGDVLVVQQMGRTTIDFEIDAIDAITALKETHQTMRSKFPELSVRRLDRDLVNVPEIAVRTDRSAESIRLLASGRRGGGDFPTPVAVLGGGGAIWEWSDIVSYFEQTGIQLEDCKLIDSSTAAWFDAALNLPEPEFGSVITFERLRAPSALARIFVTPLRHSFPTPNQYSITHSTTAHWQNNEDLLKIADAET